MKKLIVIIGVMLVMMATIALSGCTETSKFVGTWTTSGGDGTMTFSDNTVLATIQIGDASLSGTYEWAIANQKITFTEVGGTLGITLDYSFPTSSQLILTNSNGGSITLIKA